MNRSSATHRLSVQASIGLLSTLCLFAALPCVSSAALDDYNVVWDTPSADSAGSMPLGNGDIGLNTWVEANGDLLFYIAKNDAWSGDTIAPTYGAYGLIKVGRVRVSFTPSPFAAGKSFRQELHLRSGSFEVAGENGAKITLWVDANHPVIRVEASTPTASRATVKLESWRTTPTEYLQADTIVPGQKDRILWYYRSANKEVPELQNRTIGAAMFGPGLTSMSPTELGSAQASAKHAIEIHPFSQNAGKRILLSLRVRWELT